MGKSLIEKLLIDWKTLALVFGYLTSWNSTRPKKFVVHSWWSLEILGQWFKFRKGKIFIFLPKSRCSHPVSFCSFFNILHQFILFFRVPEVSYFDAADLLGDVFVDTIDTVSEHLKTVCRLQCNARLNGGFVDHETPKFCLHPSHPSVEWIDIFLWSYEICQGTIGAVLI